MSRFGVLALVVGCMLLVVGVGGCNHNHNNCDLGFGLLDGVCRPLN